MWESENYKKKFIVFDPRVRDKKKKIVFKHYEVSRFYNEIKK